MRVIYALCRRGMPGEERTGNGQDLRNDLHAGVLAREEEQSLDGLGDLNLNHDYLLFAVHDLLLEALLHLGEGRHHRVCHEVIVGPRTSWETSKNVSNASENMAKNTHSRR